MAKSSRAGSPQRTIVENVTLVVEEELRPGGAVLWEGGTIREVRALGGARRPGPARSGPAGLERIDGGGGYLAPGFMDLHVHGVRDRLVDNGPEDLEAMSRILPRFGVTGFQPAVSPRPPGEDAGFLRSLAACRPSGAAVLGFFLEGPFLSLTGALPPEAVAAPTGERLRSLIEASLPYRAVFAVSPEIEGAPALIRRMARGKTPVFVTHTAASVAQTLEAIEAGVTHATHFYDVFPVPGETEPGVRPCGAVEAILASPQVTVDFILDGEHVDPIAVRMALACKGPQGVCLITDANIGAGLPPGTYRGLGGAEVRIEYPGAPARMTENGPLPGALAGSGLTMDQAVRNAVRLLEVPLPVAVGMASANPARVLGLEGRKGHVREGYDADLVLLDPELRVQQTWVAGASCYRRSEP
ncbi:MAG: amidohydrolase family protein [Spirochaetales bacterium]|nr:amidohydrolase family protein [Spirochaetales bacterium]